MTTTREVSEMKTCGKCKASKALAEFSIRKASKDGLNAKCKVCVKASNAAWNAANKERKAATNAAWNAANKDRRAATDAAWRAANKEKAATTSAAWYAANKEKNTDTTHRRRARKATNGVNLVTAAETAAIIAQPCMACDAPAPSTVEHLIPINRGGAHTIGNLAPLCKPCNSSKSDLLWVEWKYSNRAQAQKAFAA
jgi:5-methylcytosine-specific restriction endonuclease McrA